MGMEKSKCSTDMLLMKVHAMAWLGYLDKSSHARYIVYHSCAAPAIKIRVATNFHRKNRDIVVFGIRHSPLNPPVGDFYGSYLSN
jgi:hypothetical protein